MASRLAWNKYCRCDAIFGHRAQFERADADRPQIIKCAEALAHVLKNVSIKIHKDELIVGEMAAPIKSSPIFPEFSYNWVVDEMKNHPWKDRLHDKYYMTKESEKKLFSLE